MKVSKEFARGLNVGLAIGFICGALGAMLFSIRF